MSRQTERLVHILLCEEIGSETVPDVTERVLQRAWPRDRQAWKQIISAPVRRFFREHRLQGARTAAIAAAAALLAASVLAGWWAMGSRHTAPELPASHELQQQARTKPGPEHYPPPQASGSYKLVDAKEICRGAVLVTEGQTASLALGGYCQVRLEPSTALRIEGKQGKEQVLLEKGAVQCDVNPGVGAFTVRSRVGTVSVTGTSFSVKLLERKGAATLRNNRKTAWMLVVAVATGSVSVEQHGRVFKLSAGSQQIFGEEASSGSNQSPSPRGTGRVTITGMGKALGDARGNLNPAAANATLTVTTNSAQAVYYVSGWAGVLVAKQADGKKVAITGVMGEKDGRKTISGKSSDVKIIVIEEKGR
jgi:ferric-dicitrate binding protein FerR (iron transport regulator)